MHRFRIAVALDRSEYSEIVLEHAIDQAARHDAVDLHFLTVIGPREDLEGTQTWLAQQAQQGLETLGSRGPVVRTRLHVVTGANPAAEIIAFAADLDADLLVVGRFGLHEANTSTADRVLSGAPCPTLVVVLAEHAVDPDPQCPACVEVREEFDGERWFCAKHADSRSRLSLMLPPSTSSIRGGPLL